jgi:hypothetical protein
VTHPQRVGNRFQRRPDQPAGLTKLRLLIDLVALLLGASLFIGLLRAYIPSWSLVGWLGIAASALCVLSIMSIVSGFGLQHNMKAMRAFVAAPGILLTLITYFSEHYLIPYFDYLSFISAVLMSFGILWALASARFVRSYRNISVNTLESAPGASRRDTMQERRSPLVVATWFLAGATLLAPVIGWLLSLL